jgi:hypothetical protein
MDSSSDLTHRGGRTDTHPIGCVQSPSPLKVRFSLSLILDNLTFVFLPVPPNIRGGDDRAGHRADNIQSVATDEP